ncbi:MAG: hypothetical protein K1X92_05080 [Bacteroidia bacterium]|nr:hypothetical protein [Bacteroidia bacterium]
MKTKNHAFDFIVIRIFPFLLFLLLFPVFTLSKEIDFSKIPYPRNIFVIDSVIRMRHWQQTPSFDIKTPYLEILEEANKQNDARMKFFAGYYRFSYSLIQNSEAYSEADMLRIIDSLRIEADKVNFPDIQPYLTNIIGNYYIKIKKNGLGLYYLMKGLEERNEKNQSAFKLYPGYATYRLALLFYEFGDYTKAIQLAKEVEKEKVELHVSVFNKNLLGMCYLKSGFSDTALSYFDGTMKVLQEIGPGRMKGWRGIVNGNKGFCYQAMNQLEQAILYYQNGISVTDSFNLYSNRTGFTLALASVYYQRNELAKLKEALIKAKSGVFKSGSEEHFFKYYKMLTQYHASVGDYKTALMYSDSVRLWADSLNTLSDKNIQVNAELMYEIEKGNIRQNLYLTEIHRNRYRLGLFVAIGLMIGLTFSFLFIRQRAFIRSDRAKIKREILRSESKLKEFTDIILEKNKLIEKMEQQLGEKLDEEAKLKLRDSVILTEEDWSNFRKLFEKVHPGFFARLKEKVPDLSQAEVRYIALCKLQLSGKEMSAMLGVGDTAIRQYRYRIRKKLNVEDEEESIALLVQSI